MPEFPDIVVYIEALRQRIKGQRLLGVRLNHPFLLRTAEPPLSIAQNKHVIAVERVGKRIAIGLEGELWLVLHLMIAGRLHWKKPGAKLGGKNVLAAFDFAEGGLTMTEAGSKKRASLHVLQGNGALAAHNPGGLEIFEADLERFSRTLTLRNHTLKRALTDPRLFSGIGNAYSDEILHRARLSPIPMTQKLTPDEVARLFDATRETLSQWLETLRDETGSAFPEKVTAFREGMAVHGRYSQPCPDCGAPVQRIRYASNETNYCARCQTGGKLLADRALSRLLKADWPKSLDELEKTKPKP